MRDDLEDAVKIAQQIAEIQLLTPSTHHWRVEVDRTFGFYTLIIKLQNNSWLARSWGGDVWDKSYNINPDDDPAEFDHWVIGGALKIIEERKAKLGYHGTDWEALAKALQDKLNGK